MISVELGGEGDLKNQVPILKNFFGDVTFIFDLIS